MSATAIPVALLDTDDLRRKVARTRRVLTEHGAARVIAMDGLPDDSGDELIRVAFSDLARARPHYPNPRDAFLRLRDVRPLSH